MQATEPAFSTMNLIYQVIYFHWMLQKQGSRLQSKLSSVDGTYCANANSFLFDVVKTDYFSNSYIAILTAFIFLAVLS